MIPSIPMNPVLKGAYRAYVGLFFIYLAAPLVVVSVFAFNELAVSFPALEGLHLGLVLRRYPAADRPLP